MPLVSHKMASLFAVPIERGFTAQAVFFTLCPNWKAFEGMRRRFFGFAPKLQLGMQIWVKKQRNANLKKSISTR